MARASHSRCPPTRDSRGRRRSTQIHRTVVKTRFIRVFCSRAISVGSSHRIYFLSWDAKFAGGVPDCCARSSPRRRQLRLTRWDDHSPHETGRTAHAQWLPATKMLWLRERRARRQPRPKNQASTKRSPHVGGAAQQAVEADGRARRDLRRRVSRDYLRPPHFLMRPLLNGGTLDGRRDPNWTPATSS